MVHSANKQSLLNLSHLPKARQYYIAFSGGMDSTALLHALLQSHIKDQIIAIHVNHNIDPQSDIWQQHCESFCSKHHIQCISESVQVKSHSENGCRLARRHVFEQHVSFEDCLLTGHHQSDQVETILFRLIRGTGIQGMTGMQEISNHFSYKIFRPLLQTTKVSIQQYINMHELDYVTDPSNQNDIYRRNFIRNQLLPTIKDYSQDGLQQICLTADNLKHSINLLSGLIGHDNPFNSEIFKDPSQFATAIYHWLHNHKVRLPSHKRLIQFSFDCLNSNNDKQPELLTEEYKLICWKKFIYLLHINEQNNSSSISITLTENSTITLPDNCGKLKLHCDHPIVIEGTIKFKKGKDKIHLSGHKKRHQVKNLFQTHAIPPWEREVIPYLYIDNELMAIGSKFISVNLQKLLDDQKAEYEWLSPQFLL